MSPYFELQPLVVGIFAAFPLKMFIHDNPGSEVVEAPCLAWLARGTDGRTVLVDTGPSEPTPLTAQFHVGLEVLPEHRIDSALAAAGVDASEVDTVVYTHLHFDHCGYGELLPNAKFFVQSNELQYAVLPGEKQRVGYEVGYPGVLPQWMKIFDRLQPVEGVFEVVPGCTMVPLPGHTPGSAGVLFQTRKGRFAIVGDLVNRVENWRAPGGGHAAPGLHSSLDDCYSSFGVLEKEADSVLASHDFRMLEETW